MVASKTKTVLAQGSCLCREVVYSISGNMGVFQYCHCSRCRKHSGSVHSANIFVHPKNFEWLQGEHQVGTYQPQQTKYFTTAFCKNCGSSLPWYNKTHSVVIIPAGTLDSDPKIRPKHNVYCASQADWYTPSSALTNNSTLPEKIK